MYFDLKKYSQSFKVTDWKNEIFAGLTVAMTMIPESLSFAILAGLSPLNGLYAAVIMGIITALIGGRPGMISGGAGATIIVMISLIATHGIEYLFAAVVLAGIIQVLVGVMKWGKFIKLIPLPVMYGFVNGLAVVIFLSQLDQLKTPGLDGTMQWMTGNTLLVMLGLIALTVAVVLAFPKITKKVPSSLVAIIVVALLVYFTQIDTKTVGDIATLSGGLPPFHIPMVPLNIDTLMIILPYAGIMAGVALLESLLTLSLVNDYTNSKSNANQESIGQGVANICNGFFTGMGGCAMIAQTFVSLEAGGRTRWSGIIGGLTILIIILVASPIIEQIPMAALVGVMMVIAVTTFNWGSFRIFGRMPRTDIVICIVVTLVTILQKNLALAVFVGLVIAALGYAWQQAQAIENRTSINDIGYKVYHISGSLFFGSTWKFTRFFNPNNDPENILIDMANSTISDMSAIDAIDSVVSKYVQQGKMVRLVNIDKFSLQKIQKSKKLTTNI